MEDRYHKHFLPGADCEIPQQSMSDLKKFLFPNEKPKTRKHLQSQKPPSPDPSNDFIEDIDGEDIPMESFYEAEEEVLQESPDDTLYPGCSLTREEANNVIYAFSLRAKLSRELVDHLVTVIAMLVPAQYQNRIPSSKYMLTKRLQPDFTQVMKCCYCPNCKAEISNESSEVCLACNEPVHIPDLIRSEKFFALFDIQKTLQSVLSIKPVAENLMNNLERRKASKSDVLCDITDGQTYKEYRLEGTEFSCTINTDGISPFKSSLISVWPIFVSINELDYKVRRKHTILIGLWVAKGKPNFDTFLRSLIDQCNRLSEEGFHWDFNGQQVHSKVFFPIVAADSPARCGLQGLRQYNGAYSCPCCYMRGENYNLDGGSHKWVFVPTKKPLVKRRHDQFLADVKALQQKLEANTGESSHLGVIHGSQFLRLKEFDMVDGFVFDYMHTALLGVLKAYTNMLFDSSNHREDFYLDKSTQLKINEKLSTCKGPYETRLVRDLKEIKNWKASEWRNWMTLCVPVLKPFLPHHFIYHLAKFVLAFSLLLGSRITMDDVSFSEELLQDFTLEAHALFGPKVCTFNMHLLLHASDCVKHWGPLWAYSLFQFESANGELCKMFIGQRKMCLEIVNKVIVIQRIRAVGESDFRDGQAREFFNQLMDRKPNTKTVFRFKSFTLLGPKGPGNLSDEEIGILAKVGFKEISNVCTPRYLLKTGMKFCASSYGNNPANSIMVYGDDAYIAEKIVLFRCNGKKYGMVFGRKIFTQPYSFCETMLKVIRLSPRLQTFPCQDALPIKHFAILNDDGELEFITRMLNSFEID